MSSQASGFYGPLIAFAGLGAGMVFFLLQTWARASYDDSLPEAFRWIAELRMRGDGDEPKTEWGSSLVAALVFGAGIIVISYFLPGR